MRHKNTDWSLLDKLTTWDQAIVSLLMDVRDELQALNRLLNCPNFLDIPAQLENIRQNTKKPRKKAAS